MNGATPSGWGRTERKCYRFFTLTVHVGRVHTDIALVACWLNYKNVQTKHTSWGWSERMRREDRIGMKSSKSSISQEACILMCECISSVIKQISQAKRTQHAALSLHICYNKMASYNEPSTKDSQKAIATKENSYCKLWLLSAHCLLSACSLLAISYCCMCLIGVAFYEPWPWP